MFTFMKSYGEAWRVFVPVEADTNVHQHMKNNCIWGGHDKRDLVDGKDSLGYEFKDIGVACDVVRGCTLYLE
jgi:hypothetical protein